ncbi:MAG TPA: molybdopterin-dependent oxidoreductase [Candidatus Acidoferrum sp.]|nr:molybdopterin-dependent oxidoreductase [Candidatus Acidoferrum sp.]
MRKLGLLLILVTVTSALTHPKATAAQNAAPILIVEGAVDHRLELTAADLAAMPRAHASITDHDEAKKDYEGVPLVEILQRAGAPMGDKLRGQALTLGFVVEAADGYKVAFTLSEVDSNFGNKMAIVADKVGGALLAGDEAPLRIIVPGEKHLARSARMVKRIVVVRIGG